MSRVFRALDREDERIVALKLLDPDACATDRFKEEARLLASLDHPAIVRYVAHGVGEHGDPFLAMEWLEGEDLAARLRRGPLEQAEALRVVRQAGAGLATAHARGIVHRDLKPANLFLVGGDLDQLKVLDFGIAIMDATTHARAGAIAGTPGYMAPEQAEGRAAISPAADVFALGCNLYEMLAMLTPEDRALGAWARGGVADS
jgi:eukaryotic-like serine/threonine-protein kinase